VITSFDPRTGAAIREVAVETTADEVGTLCTTADETAKTLDRAGRAGRARMLRSMAQALEDDRPELVATGEAETALGVGRLEGELTRTTYQLSFFADVIEDGGYLEAVIDHAGQTPMGARPDLRRVLRPVGPVAVFGASNFPFAFSVPGGDTASALAAGCPVVVKAHEAHPATSQLCAAALRRGAAAADLPEQVIGLVYGVAAGIDLVRDPRIQAVGFTGSLQGGRALADLAAARPAPIPFYGELGAVNPLVVCPNAAENRPGDIAVGLTGSFTLGGGQFCTKPGLAFVPGGPLGDKLVADLSASVTDLGSVAMLSERVHTAFMNGSSRLRELADVSVLAQASAPTDRRGWWGTPVLLQAEGFALDGGLLEECFGPVLIVVRYDSENDLANLLARIGPALTASIHADSADLGMASRLVDWFAGRVGRIVWNGYPTGVAVAWATHHGGPYPATTAVLHTSVGASAIRRWLRPVTYQDLPPELLPAELRDNQQPGTSVPRRVNGVLELR
jgi:NADP-dependent aldehyde dehydrogenase